MLSVKELASALGVSAKTIYSMCERDEIPYYRIGVGRGTLRFDIEEVKRRLKAEASAASTMPLKPTKSTHLL